MLNNESFQPARLISLRDIGPSIRLFEIQPEAGISAYEPGSHIDIALEIAGRPAMRSYSLIGEPAGGLYRIAVKRVSQSRGGSAALWQLQPGAPLSISRPKSGFRLQFGAPAYLLIAGGIGITPLLGMADALARHGARYRLAYAAHAQADLAFGDDLATWHGEKADFFVSAKGRRLDLAAEIAALPEQGLIYFCGPQRMLAALRAALRQAGRPEQALRFETFGSGGNESDSAFWISIPNLGARIEVPEGRSMLDALEAAGIEMLADCRRGECGLCAVDVLGLEGHIDHRDVFLSEHQKQGNGKICACVSRIKGGGATIDVAYRPEL